MNKNKNALITGSTSGIGLATAEVLAEAGFNLMLNGLESAVEGDALARRLSDQFGCRVFYCQADLSQPEEVIRLTDTATDHLGQVDVLINNAGIQYTESLANFPLEKWQQIQAINLTAPFLAMQQLMPQMQSNGWGRVINIASVHGLVASANKSAYCAAKHGLVGMTKVAAIEYAESNMTANCICPGWTDTPILNHQFNVYAEANNLSFEEAQRGLVKTKAPYPELINPQAIGQMILFLCSDAARAMTGTALPIDGGWTAQ